MIAHVPTFWSPFYSGLDTSIRCWIRWSMHTSTETSGKHLKIPWNVYFWIVGVRRPHIVHTMYKLCNTSVETSWWILARHFIMSPSPLAHKTHPNHYYSPLPLFHKHIPYIHAYNSICILSICNLEYFNHDGMVFGWCNPYFARMYWGTCVFYVQFLEIIWI